MIVDHFHLEGNDHRDLRPIPSMVGLLPRGQRSAIAETQSTERSTAGESGEPLRETLHYARDLLDLANETLADDPQAGEHACGMAMHMAEQVAAVGALLGPMAAG